MISLLPLKRNIQIGMLTGYQTPLTASYLFEIIHEKDLHTLSQIYTFCQEHSLPYRFISGGTNTLFARDRYDGVIIKNSLKGYQYCATSQQLTSYSGESIWKVAEDLENIHHQPLWHRFIGLPGAIAGAVYGNAGCFGLETQNNLVSIRVYDLINTEIFTLDKASLDFGYRHSRLKTLPHLFIIDATFDLSYKSEKYASDVDNIDFRNNKQPKGPSCGSFFQNPSKEASAGSLIESVGLKGYRLGGARWSDLHANFLLADGEGVTGEDLISLVRYTQSIVKEKTGYELINEVNIVE